MLGLIETDGIFVIISGELLFMTGKYGSICSVYSALKFPVRELNKIISLVTCFGEIKTVVHEMSNYLLIQLCITIILINTLILLLLIFNKDKGHFIVKGILVQT